MDFLALCKEVRRECAVSGEITTVTDQSGILGKLVSWTNLAYEEIQGIRTDWLFRYADKTFDTTSGNDVYLSEVADVARLNKESLKMYQTSVGKSDEGRLHFIPFIKFRDLYEMGETESGKPQFFTERPNGAIQLYPIPDDDYTVTFSFQSKIDSMTNNDDTPIVPSDHQATIILKACIFYCDHEEAGQQRQTFNERLKVAMNDLNRNQREQISIGAGGLGE